MSSAVLVSPLKPVAMRAVPRGKRHRPARDTVAHVSGAQPVCGTLTPLHANGLWISHPFFWLNCLMPLTQFSSGLLERGMTSKCLDHAAVLTNFLNQRCQPHPARWARSRLQGSSLTGSEWGGAGARGGNSRRGYRSSHSPPPPAQGTGGAPYRSSLAPLQAP